MYSRKSVGPKIEPWGTPALDLDISSATDWVAPDLLKALAILSDTTVRRSAVHQEHLKPYWK